MTCGIEAGGGTRVVLGMVQADRARVSDFMRSVGSLHRALVARAEVWPVMIGMPQSLCAGAACPLCPVLCAGGALDGLPASAYA